MNLKGNRGLGSISRVWRQRAILLALLILLALAASSRAWAEAAPLASLDEVVAKLPHVDASGEVVTTNGQAVANADVFLYFQRGRSGMRDRLAARTKTDVQGKFHFEKAVVWEPITEKHERNATPKYAVIARHPTFGIGFSIFLKGDPTADLKLRLKGAKFTDLTIKDNKGKPLEGALVYLADGAFDTPSTGKREYQNFRPVQRHWAQLGPDRQNGKVKLMQAADSTFFAEKEGYAKGWWRSMTLYPRRRSAAA